MSQFLVVVPAAPTRAELDAILQPVQARLAEGDLSRGVRVLLADEVTPIYVAVAHAHLVRIHGEDDALGETVANTVASAREGRVYGKGFYDDALAAAERLGAERPAGLHSWAGDEDAIARLPQVIFQWMCDVSGDAGPRRHRAFVESFELLPEVVRRATRQEDPAIDLLLETGRHLVLESLVHTARSTIRRKAGPKVELEAMFKLGFLALAVVQANDRWFFPKRLDHAQKSALSELTAVLGIRGADLGDALDRIEQSRSV